MNGNKDRELSSGPPAARESGLPARRVRARGGIGRAGHKIGTDGLLTWDEVAQLRAELARDPRAPLHRRRPASDSGVQNQV